MNKCQFSTLPNITSEMVEASPEMFCWSDCLSMHLVTDKALTNALNKGVRVSWARIVENATLSGEMWESLFEREEVMDYLNRGYKINKTSKLGKAFIDKYVDYLEIGAEFLEALYTIKDQNTGDVRYEANSYIEYIECGILERHEKVQLKLFLKRHGVSC